MKIKCINIVLFSLLIVLAGFIYCDYNKVEFYTLFENDNATEAEIETRTEIVINTEAEGNIPSAGITKTIFEVIKETEFQESSVDHSTILTEAYFNTQVYDIVTCIKNEQDVLTSSPEAKVRHVVTKKKKKKKAVDGTRYKYYEVVDNGERISMSKELQEYTYDLCVKYGIEEYFTLILAQLYRESGYKAIVSDTNDYGIAQINKCNHKWLSKELGITDFMDDRQSILCCIYLMNDNLKEHGVESGLSKYNTGKPYNSTPYARSIMKIWYNDIKQIKE